MPRVQRAKGPLNRFEDLANELAAELRAPNADAVQPIILEDTSEATRTMQTQVVWQKWENVPHEQRTAVILDAYIRAFGEEKRREITLALGFDFVEAKRIGLLPVELRPSSRITDQRVLESHRQAMRELGAPVEYADHGPVLWFARIEDAEAAKERLERVVENSKWTIVEDRYGDSDVG